MSKRENGASVAGPAEKLRASGFQVSEQPGGNVLVEKNGCAAVLSLGNSRQTFVVRPGLLVRGRIAQLVDKGYQKFWKADDLEFPALAGELRALHNYEKDLRAALGITMLYNEALGTVSSRYLYDRVEGREDNRYHESFD